MVLVILQIFECIFLLRFLVDCVCEILIVDDYLLMCDVLVLMLKISFGLKNVCIVCSFVVVQDQIWVQGVLDVVIFDLNLFDVWGVEGLVMLCCQILDVLIIMILVDLENVMILVVMVVGVQGYISKFFGCEVLVESLCCMWEGEWVIFDSYQFEYVGEEDVVCVELVWCFVSLMLQQMKILWLICQGKVNKEISYELFIVEVMVKIYIIVIMFKINVWCCMQVVFLVNSVRLFELV